MKKKWFLITFVAVILALYVGMASRTEHPKEQLQQDMMEKINKTRVINFKSGYGVTVYDAEHKEIKQQWQYKRAGVYDAWSKFVHYKNLTHFEQVETTDEEAEKKTSLTVETKGNMIALPTKEAYFKNNMYFAKNRATAEWSYHEQHSLELLELLPFHAEVMNRYAKYYKAMNRGDFVVYFYSVDPNYLTRTFPTILKAEDQTFPLRFKEGTIKILVYPDTNLPKRIYSIFSIENLDTGEIYEYNIDTWFSENESYVGDDEPAIPLPVQKYRK